MRGYEIEDSDDYEMHGMTNLVLDRRRIDNMHIISGDKGKG